MSTILIIIQLEIFYQFLSYQVKIQKNPLDLNQFLTQHKINQDYPFGNNSLKEFANLIG